MKSPNSVHKHAIFVQDFPESLIANEHLNRAIHDAVGAKCLWNPPYWGLLLTFGRTPSTLWDRGCSAFAPLQILLDNSLNKGT